MDRIFSSDVKIPWVRFHFFCSQSMKVNIIHQEIKDLNIIVDDSFRLINLLDNQYVKILLKIAILYLILRVLVPFFK